MLSGGKLAAVQYKTLLPTYDVFDEDRYFEPAHSVAPLLLGAKKIGVTICEDIWTEHYLPRPLYDVYEHAPKRLWGLSAITDQQIAGITMASEQAVVFFAVFTFFFLRFLRDEEPVLQLSARS